MKILGRSLGFLAVWLAAFAARADINIAIITPMSGDYKYFSEELIDGAKIAVDEINNRGGLQGKKVNLVPIDDPCDDVLSLSAAQMIALNKTDDKMSLVLGPHCPNSADAIADLLHKAKIVQIHPVGIENNRYIKPRPEVIRFTGYTDKATEKLIDFIDTHYPMQTLGVVYERGNFDMEDNLKIIRNKYAGVLERRVVEADFVATHSSMKQAAAKVVEEGAELVYIMGGGEKILELSERIRDLDQDMVIFADRYSLRNKFARKSNAMSQESYLLSMPALTANSYFAPSLVRLRLWGIEPEGLMPYGYLAVKMWAGLIRQAKSFRYERILSELRGKKINTGWDEVVYRGGVPQKQLPYTIYRIRNGKYTQVY